MKFLVVAFLCLTFLTACTPGSNTLQSSPAGAANTNEISKSPVADNANTLVEANNRSEKPAISADGQHIAFVSWASNLTANDQNSWPDIFLYQKATTQFTLVSVAGNGTQQLIGVTDMLADISGNGRYIVFATPINNLVPNDTNGHQDIFVYDQQTATIIRVSGN